MPALAAFVIERDVLDRLVFAVAVLDFPAVARAADRDGLDVSAHGFDEVVTGDDRVALDDRDRQV